MAGTWAELLILVIAGLVGKLHFLVHGCKGQMKKKGAGQDCGKEGFMLYGTGRTWHVIRQERERRAQKIKKGLQPLQVVTL